MLSNSWQTRKRGSILVPSSQTKTMEVKHKLQSQVTTDLNPNTIQVNYLYEKYKEKTTS